MHSVSTEPADDGDDDASVTGASSEAGQSHRSKRSHTKVRTAWAKPSPSPAVVLSPGLSPFPVVPGDHGLFTPHRPATGSKLTVIPRASSRKIAELSLGASQDRSPERRVSDLVTSVNAGTPSPPSVRKMSARTAALSESPFVTVSTALSPLAKPPSVRTLPPIGVSSIVTASMESLPIASATSALDSSGSNQLAQTGALLAMF